MKLKASYSYKVEGLKFLWSNNTLGNHGNTHVLKIHICCLLHVVKTVKITFFSKNTGVDTTSSDSLGIYSLSNTLCP